MINRLAGAYLPSRGIPNPVNEMADLAWLMLPGEPAKYAKPSHGGLALRPKTSSAYPQVIATPGGLFPGARYFDGSNNGSYIETSDCASVPSDSKGATIGCFFYRLSDWNLSPGNLKYYGLISWGDLNSSKYNGILLYEYGDGGKIYFQADLESDLTNRSYAEIGFASTTYLVRQWASFVGVFPSLTVGPTIYLNGIDVSATKSVTGTIAWASGSSYPRWRIGRTDTINNSTDYTWLGWIACPFVAYRAFSAVEVKEYHRAPYKFLLGEPMFKNRLSSQYNPNSMMVAA